MALRSLRAGHRSVRRSGVVGVSEAHADEVARLAAELGKTRWPWGESESHWITRSALLRGLGFIDGVAFFSLSRQMDGLIGSHGLLPAAQYLRMARAALGGAAVVELPNLFWLSSSDRVMHAACYVGLALSLLAMAGFANALIMGALWILYLSFVHAGQVFYGYGWELLTLEAGFLAIFLAPPWALRAFSRSPPSAPVLWPFRWLTFRVMLGPGLIKLRAEPCWVQLTCLAHHYQTQPNS